jgi:uncharacterized protein with PIN domain
MMSALVVDTSAVMALARQRGEPLLFKGADFTLTDIRSAIPTTP